MCTYSIQLDDKVVSEARSSFASEEAMQVWIQQEVESLLSKFSAAQKHTIEKARKAIDSMRSQSEQNGNSEITLAEINEEIRQSRAARKAIS